MLTLTMTGGSISATLQKPFSGVVATVIDTDLQATPASFNSVSINWGDGQTSTGTVVGPLLFPGYFQVIGTHTYTQTTATSTLITVSTTTGAGASTTGTVTVAAPPFPVLANTLMGAPNVQLTGLAVATFQAPNSTTTLPAGSSAIINWGDGLTSVGLIQGGPGAFTVYGTHTYAAADTYTTTVIVAIGDGPTSTGTGQAVIVSPTPQYTPTPQPIVEPVSQAFTALLATFTDTSASDLASIFTVSVDWGDGNTTSATVTGGNGSFNVYGTYTYLTAGTYPVTVTVADQSGNSFTVTDTATATTLNLSNTTVQFTGALAPIPANGPHASKGYTNTNQPTFSGTALPFSTIQLYARPFGIDTQLQLGETVATITGQWSLSVGPLLPGTYNFSAVVTPSSGSPSVLTPLADNGLVHIDMVPKASKAQIRHQIKLTHTKPPHLRHPHQPHPKPVHA